jgi:hypothetical protein
MSEQNKPEEKGTVKKVLGFLKLDFVREVVHNLGGRKLLAAGGGLAVINEIVARSGETLAWPHAVACLAVAIVSVGFGAVTAIEDKAKKE